MRAHRAARKRRWIGASVATVYPQVPAGRANATKDGTPRVYRNVTLQLREERSIEAESRGQRSFQTWDLFAPAGFVAGAQDQVTVVPGPTEPDGTPARLFFIGDADPQVDSRGDVDHVRSMLRRRIGG